MREIISHPGKPLIVHLQKVARLCKESVSQSHFDLGINKELLQKLAFIQGAVHDIGKASNNFQTYIHSGGELIIRPKHHALISAYLAKLIAEQYLQEHPLPSWDRKILPYFLFTSVKRHHGNVRNFSDELESLSEKEEDLKVLRANFPDEQVQEILNTLLAEIDFHFSHYLFNVPPYAENNNAKHKAAIGNIHI